MTGRAGAAVAVVAGLVALAGCTSVVVPTMPDIASSVSVSAQGRQMAFTVSPWPLDDTVAFLCRERPGPEFTVEDPTPHDDAGCVPLEVAVTGDTLTARFAAESVSPDVVGELARSGPPWFLAVAGARGPFAAATTLTVIDSPIFSPPGPS